LNWFYYCPTKEREFSELTASEANCRSYLTALRWPRGVVCPYCGHNRPGTLKKGYRCRNPDCRGEFLVTTGTIFERSRLTLRDWFTMIWRMVYDSNLQSAAGFKREFLPHALGSSVAAWRYQSKLRKLMTQSSERLTGDIEYTTTEIFARGGARIPVLVFVVRRHNRRGQIRLRRVLNFSQKEVAAALLSAVHKERSVLFAESSDGFESLRRLGYQLRTAPQTKLERVQKTCGELNLFFQKNHRGGIDSGSVDLYLDEFAFRFNERRKPKPGYIFRTLLLRAMQPSSSR
jgi:hypothetical protein